MNMPVPEGKPREELSRRTRVTAFSGSRAMFSFPMNTSPRVGRSRPAMQCIRVDLPEPEGPMTAVKLPLPIATVTSSTATTG